MDGQVQRLPYLRTPSQVSGGEGGSLLCGLQSVALALSRAPDGPPLSHSSFLRSPSGPPSHISFTRASCAQLTAHQCPGQCQRPQSLRAGQPLLSSSLPCTPEPLGASLHSESPTFPCSAPGHHRPARRRLGLRMQSPSACPPPQPHLQAASGHLPSLAKGLQGPCQSPPNGPLPLGLCPPGHTHPAAS